MFDDLTGFAALNYSFSLSSASLWIAPFAALTAHGSLSPSQNKKPGVCRVISDFNLDGLGRCLMI